MWKPSPVTRFDILFPNPKFTQQLITTAGGTEWWWYLSGDYGGGVWTIKRSRRRHVRPEDNQIDLVDYDDIRVALGIDFKRPAGMTGFFEGGYAFQRELNLCQRPARHVRPQRHVLRPCRSVVLMAVQSGIAAARTP